MCQRRHLHLHLEAAACRVAALVLVAACLVAARSALLAIGVESGPVPRRETAGTPHTQTVLGPEHPRRRFLPHHPSPAYSPHHSSLLACVCLLVWRVTKTRWYFQNGKVTSHGRTEEDKQQRRWAAWKATTTAATATETAAATEKEATKEKTRTKGLHKRHRHLHCTQQHF